MNIVQTTITYPPALGGLDRHVKEISEGLVGRGHRVSVVTTDLAQPMSRTRLSIPANYVDLASVHRLHTVRIPRIPFPVVLGLRQVISETRPDLIHAFSVAHSTTYSAWRFARRKGIPLVVSSIFSPRTGLFWMVYRRAARQILNDAACVIAISEFERTLLTRAGMSGRKVTVLAPGVDLAPLMKPSISVLPRYGLEHNRVIVSLGRLATGKRVDRLIRAMPAVLARHPDVRLLVIGPDYGDGPKLLELSRSLKLDGFVIFTGPLEQDDVTSALQHATVFAMTTDFELFGITLIEAMAAGAPVVAPNVASVPEVVRGDETGLLYSHDDVDDLAGKLNIVLSNEGLRRHLIDAGKAEASTRFDFQRNLDSLEEIYLRARNP